MDNDHGLSVSIKNINKYFGNNQVLHGLNLQFDSGDYVSIVGKSGCGKSTLLRLIAHLENVSEGEINFNTKSKTARPQENVRLMFQDSRLLPWKTILDNVRLGLDGKTSKDKAIEVLNEVGLIDKISEWPANLSGGQRQRVALARALIHKPKLLLLDEPLGALDALTRKEMQLLIEKLWQQYQFTVILVTHDIHEAVITSNRVILLEQGQVGLDIAIPLARPRLDLREIAYYEQIILNKLLASKLPQAEFEI